MDRFQRDLLLEIMETSFVLDELTLYLDTHPNDERALRMHNNNSRVYQRLKNTYQARYGPLTNRDLSGYPWAYVNGPWPWEINFENF